MNIYIAMKTDQKKIMDDGTKIPHPAPDPTQPGKGKPGTQIPVSPDEDNDFSTPTKEIKEPENPSESPVKVPSRENPATKGFPAPDDKPLPDSPLNPPKNDPDRISPATPGNPALQGSTTKGIVFSVILVFLLSFQPMRADNKTDNPVTTPRTENTEVIQLYKRLETLRSMDKSELTKSEKKELRTEVKQIRHRLSDIDGGVYISAGALIVILILLIILV